MSRPRAGFTLLELVLATAVTAVLALTLYTTMGIGFRARSTIERQIDAPRRAAIVLDLLERELQSAVRPVGVLAGPAVGEAMGTVGAEADTFTFYAMGNDGSGDALGEGIRRVTLTRADVGAPSNLVMQVQRNLLASVEGEPTTEVLAHNVRAFAVRYYDGFGWQQDWDSTTVENSLPLAVELTVELAPDDDADAPGYRMTRIVPLSPGRIASAGSLFGVSP